jgi:hypothetical protein
MVGPFFLETKFNFDHEIVNINLILVIFVVAIFAVAIFATE